MTFHSVRVLALELDTGVDGCQFYMSVVPSVGDFIIIDAKLYLVESRTIDAVTSHVELFVRKG